MNDGLAIRARRHGSQKWEFITEIGAPLKQVADQFQNDILIPKTNEDFAEAELVRVTVEKRRSGIFTQDGAKAAAESEGKRIAEENAKAEAQRKAKQADKSKPANGPKWTEAQLEAIKAEQKLHEANRAKAAAESDKSQPAQTEQPATKASGRKAK